MKKVLTALLLVGILILSTSAGFVSVSAVNSGTVSVSTANALTGETVSLNVSLSNNPGLVAMRLLLNYDTSKLALQSVSNGVILAEGTEFFGNNYSAVPFIMCWDDSLATSNSTANGVLATLTFLVLPSVLSGSAAVSVEVDDGSTFDKDMNAVSFTTTAGSVLVTSDTPPSIELSDATGSRGDDVTIPVILSNNPGITSLNFDLFYDTSALELIQIADKGLLSANSINFGIDMSASPYNISWSNPSATENDYANGTIVEMVFRLRSTSSLSETDISIEVDIDYTYDIDEEPVEFEPTGSIITIDDPALAITDPLEGSENSINSLSLNIVESENFEGTAKNYIIGADIYSIGVTADYCGIDHISGVVEDYNATGIGREIVCVANEYDAQSTGAKIEIRNNGIVEESYDIVVFGDVNGDGCIDSTDVVIIKNIQNGFYYDFIETGCVLDSPYYLAADVNGDWCVDATDLVLVKNAVNLGNSISQEGIWME